MTPTSSDGFQESAVLPISMRPTSSEVVKESAVPAISMRPNSSEACKESALLPISSPIFQSLCVADSDRQMLSGEFPASVQSSLSLCSSTSPPSFQFSMRVATTGISAFLETRNSSSASHAIKGTHMIMWVIGVMLLLLLVAAVLVWSFYMG
jgi:hypothetical protein